MSQIGRVDAISYLIEPAEHLRDAPIEVVRSHVRAHKEEILESVTRAIFENFVSTPRVVHSIQEAGGLNQLDAARAFDTRLKKFTQ